MSTKREAGEQALQEARKMLRAAEEAYTAASREMTDARIKFNNAQCEWNRLRQARRSTQLRLEALERNLALTLARETTDG